MKEYKTELKKLIADEVVNLIKAVSDPMPADHYGYDVLEGYIRERYGYISGLSDAAELAGLPFNELQAIKNSAAEEANGTDWYAVLDQINY